MTQSFDVDLKIISKDVHSLIKIIGQQITYARGIKFWQVRNLDLLESDRAEVKKAREQRLQISKKMLILEQLIDSAQSIKSDDCIVRLTMLEDDLLEIERRELQEAIKAEKMRNLEAIKESKEESKIQEMTQA